MKVDVIYPPVTTHDRRSARRRRVLIRALLILICAALITNWQVGGPAWSVVAAWAALALYRLVLSPEPVERGSVSVLVRALLYIVVTMVLVEMLLAPGWAETAIPLAAAGALLISAVLSVIDMENQQPLSMNMLLLTLLSGLALPACRLLNRPLTWPIWTLSGLAALLLALGLMIYRREVFSLLQKFWHIR